MGSGTPSRIALIPERARKQLEEWLYDPATTQLEATDRLNGLLKKLGIEEPVSRHSVGRYARRIERAGKRMREARELARICAETAGVEDVSNQAKMGIELLHQMLFDATALVSEEEADPDGIDDRLERMKSLALILRRVVGAAKMDADHAAAIRRDAAEQALRAAEEMSGADGTVRLDRLRADVERIFGVAAR